MSIRELAALVSLWGTTAVAGGVGYAQATAYFKQDSRPTLYQPLNLLDGRDATAWCSPTSDPLNDVLTFGFSAPVRLDELRVSNGNNFDTGTWGTFSRVSKIVIRSGKRSQTFTLEDLRGPQSVRLEPPMTGARFVVEILDTFPAEDPDQPVCLTDIVFYTDGKPLNGPWLTTRLKYDRSAAPLLGTWFAGFSGTPDRFWSFNFDGTFNYRYEPYDELTAKPRTLDGTYDVSATKLVLDIKGKRTSMGFVRLPRKGGSFELKLDGEPPADLKGEWRSTP